MKHLITVVSIATALFIGYAAGNATAEPEVITETVTETVTEYIEHEPEVITETVTEYIEHEVVDVAVSDAGVQIVYEDGTGYWYEYEGAAFEDAEAQVFAETVKEE